MNPLHSQTAVAGLKSSIALLGVLALVSACGSSTERSDAYGNFETTEIMVSSEAAGHIKEFNVSEGTDLVAGEMVGYIDTVQLALQKDQLVASRQAMQARMAAVEAQIAVLQEQRRVAMVERERVARLLEDHAATTKQRDDVEGEISVLDRQIVSTRSQNGTIRKEIEAVDAQVRQIEDRLRKLLIVNPVSGTVLVKYAEPFEHTGGGAPLYKIADLKTMYLRAYVTGDQLPHLTLGQKVAVLIDENRDENRSLEGAVSWIASEAEFTPKTIQTKSERVNLVYAFKVRVDNPDGRIKVGMPGEVVFTQ